MEEPSEGGGECSLLLLTLSGVPQMLENWARVQEATLEEAAETIFGQVRSLCVSLAAPATSSPSLTRSCSVQETTLP